MNEAFDLKLDPQGRMVLVRPGVEDAVDVRVRRSFPWSSPGRNVSIRSKEGKELVMIDDLANLSQGLRGIVENYLAGTSMIPRITRVMAVDVRFGFQQWTVETDRGPADFRVQEREDIRFMADGRFTVKDADGTIYELPRMDQLDDISRRAIEAVV
jgi:hypothetical protein